MPETIEYAGSVAVVGGPQFSFKRTITSGGYQKFQIEVDQGATKKIDLGIASTEKVRLLAITSSKYDKLLTFVLNAPATPPATAVRELDQPLLIAGTAGIELIGAALTDIQFTNGLTEKIVIDLVIVRDPEIP